MHLGASIMCNNFLKTEMGGKKTTETWKCKTLLPALRSVTTHLPSSRTHVLSVLIGEVVLCTPLCFHDDNCSAFISGLSTKRGIIFKIQSILIWLCHPAACTQLGFCLGVKTWTFQAGVLRPEGEESRWMVKEEQSGWTLKTIAKSAKLFLPSGGHTEYTTNVYWKENH